MNPTRRIIIISLLAILLIAVSASSAADIDSASSDYSLTADSINSINADSVTNSINAENSSITPITALNSENNDYDSNNGDGFTYNDSYLNRDEFESNKSEPKSDATALDTYKTGPSADPSPEKGSVSAGIKAGISFTYRYYFNASASSDGNGSKESPYKYLKSSRIKDSSINYLADGTYSLDSTISKSNIAFIGECASETIITFNGRGFDSEALILENITLRNMNILNKGNLTAENAIFIGGKGYNGGYDNTFGGAIYASGRGNHTEIINCTFINNTAAYGGAIKVIGGELTIEDSRFIDNTAQIFGGAIALEGNYRSNIKNTEFHGDVSLYDAGGAIFIRDSQINGSNLSFFNCSADFGAGLCSLNSNTYLYGIEAKSNSAKYDGGAIYQFYGALIVEGSLFEGNSASRGGAAFIDNCSSLKITGSRFTGNNASNAGAIYSLCNNMSKSLADPSFSNNFSANQALNNSNLLESKNVSLRIGNGNVTLYHNNESEIDEIPSYYNLNDYGLVTSVKDQQAGGNCWAYAALASLESCILKAEGEALDLSEENMKNLMALFSDYGYVWLTNDGGNDDLAVAYLNSWLGPVKEEDDPDDDMSFLSPVLDSFTHIQNILYVGRSSFTDNDQIKEAIMKYGAVSTSFYMDLSKYNAANKAYYYNTNQDKNHAVTIVGWNDTFSRNKFRTAPAGDGAWIVKNSWNDDWGDNGYFYVSYYDTSMMSIGYATEGFTFVFNDSIKLDKNYQYDISGKTDIFLNSSSTAWYKAVYVAEEDEYLAAVSTYFNKLTDYAISIIVNGKNVHNQSGIRDTSYSTIYLTDFIPLKAGDTFEVVFKINVSGEAGIPISEKSSFNKGLYGENQSFISYDGISWIDLNDVDWTYSSLVYGGHYYISAAVCIKAFSFIDPIETATSIEIVYDPDNQYLANLLAHVTNEYGRDVNYGKLTFRINGEDIIAELKDGLANISYSFSKLENEVSALFEGAGYISSSDITEVRYSKMNVTLDLETNIYGRSVAVKVNASKRINETVILNFNGQEHPVNLTDGYVEFKLDGLEKTDYVLKANLNNSDIYIWEEASAEFSIASMFSEILASDLATDDYSNEIYMIMLVDENGTGIGGKTVLFNITANGEQKGDALANGQLNGGTAANDLLFNASTDSKGYASIPISLDGGNYTIGIQFQEDDFYNSSQAIANIKVRAKVAIRISFNQNVNDLEIVVELNRTINETVIFSFAGESGILNMKDGKASANFTGLANGNYTAEAYLENDIDYISAIAEEDIEIDIGNLIINAAPFNTTEHSNESYSILLLDEEGNAIAGKTLEFTLNEKTEYATTDENGIASITIDLSKGNYTVNVKFHADNQYFSNEAEAEIKVKEKVSIQISFNQRINDVEVIIELDKPLNETVKLSFAGESRTLDAKEGKASANFTGLANGNYTAEAYLESDTSYISGIAEEGIGINVRNMTIKADSIRTRNSSMDYIIRLLEGNNPIPNKSLNIEIDESSLAKTTDSQGRAIIPLDLDIGIHEIGISFDGDNDFFKAVASRTIEVVENLSADIEISTLVGDANIVLKFSKNINGTVYLKVNGTSHPTAVKNGAGELNLTGLDNGNYIVTLDMEEYLLVEEKDFAINTTIDLISGDFNCSEHSNSTYEVRLENNGKALANRTVKFVLNNTTSSKTTDNEGKAYLNIDLSPGSYDLTIIYFDDSHRKVQKVYVTANESNIANETNGTNNSNQTSPVNNQTNNTNPNNNQTNNTNPINNQTNNTNPVNNQTNNTNPINNQTNNTNPNNNQTNNTNPNNNQTNNTNPNNNQTNNTNPNNNQTNNTNPNNNQTNNTNPNNNQTNNTETKTIRKGTTITYSDMTTTAIDSKVDGRIGEYFIVRLLDKNGTPLANKPIKIGFNGRVYDKTTNASGYAKLQINLGYEGLYTFAVAFLGDDDYTGDFIVAKIKVNLQKAKLTSSNKAYKSASKSKTLSASFKTAAGKAISGKKISFTVNGKTYTAKTNKNGIASVKVSLSKKGTYKFTVKFEGSYTYASTKISKRLTIK